MTFEKPDRERFKNLELANQAMLQGGNMPCIVNAANEIVVDAFLHEKISFYGMSDAIGHAMEQMQFIKTPTYEDYVLTDSETRKYARSII